MGENDTSSEATVATPPEETLDSQIAAITARLKTQDALAKNISRAISAGFLLLISSPLLGSRLEQYLGLPLAAHTVAWIGLAIVFLAGWVRLNIWVNPSVSKKSELE